MIAPMIITTEPKTTDQRRPTQSDTKGTNGIAEMAPRL